MIVMQKRRSSLNDLDHSDAIWYSSRGSMSRLFGAAESKTPALVMDKEAGTSILAAVMLSGLLFFTGVTVDFGLALFEKRKLQAATDLAALAASQNLPSAPSIVNDMLSANGFPSASVTALVPGIYIADPKVSPASRFTSGVAPANAIRLSTSLAVPMRFIRAVVPNATLTVPASATSVQIAEAGLVGGSGLAAVGAGLPNAILGGLLGSNLSLSLASYQGMAQVQINTLDFLNALAGQLGVSAGTYGQLLSGSASMGAILNAEIQALGNEGSLAGGSAAVAGLQSLAAQITGSPTVQLSTLLSAGIWQNAQIGRVDRSSALEANMNVYQVTSFAAQIADGANLVSSNTAPLSIPGIASVNVATTAIEPPQGSYFAVGPAGMIVHTAQVRLLLTISLLNSLALGLLIPPASIQLQVYVEVANGTASLTSIACGRSPATDGTVGVSATSGVANAYVGSVDPSVMSNFSKTVTVNPATIVSALGVLLVTARGTVGVTGKSQSLVFDAQQITGAQSQRIGSTNMTSNLLQGLQNSQMTISVLGQTIGLTQSAIANSVTALLAPVFANLDSVTDQVLSTLGVQVGYLDVTVTGERCGVPALIQ